MHNEQNVWQQEVMTGLSKNSLQTWQRRADSSGASSESGVSSHWVGSEISLEVSIIEL